MAAYQRFIDELVDISSRSVARNRIMQHGTPTRVNESDLPLNLHEEALKTVFSKLNEEEREVLADAFQNERIAAIHDIASFLEWATDADDLIMSWNGEAVGPSPYNSMHGDFIGRLSGDAWDKYTTEEKY